MSERKNDNAIVTNLEMKTKIYLFLLFSRDRGHTRVRALLYTRNRTFIIFIITIFFFFTTVHFKLFGGHCAIRGRYNIIIRPIVRVTL